MVWKHLFNKAADNLERSTENEDECKLLGVVVLVSLHVSCYHILTLVVRLIDSILKRSIFLALLGRNQLNPIDLMHIIITDMIHEYQPITNTFVSVPADMGQLNCAAFLAGIIGGILDSARFVSV